MVEASIVPRQANPHQVEALRLSVERETFALFMEQRTRKTKIVTDTAAIRAARGDINGALVVAWPNGVQHRWNEDWPLDWPEELPYKAIAWRAGKTTKDELRELLNFDGFAAFFMNSESLLRSDLAWSFVQHFLKHRRLLVAADEASYMKTPSAGITKRMLAVGRHPNAVIRRILDGTPASEGSMDLWSPCAFLDWQLLGHKSFFTFQQRYAVMTTGYAPGGREFKKQAVDPETGLKQYQNLDELTAKLKTFSYRVRRRDVSNSPDPEYRSVHFELTPKQRRIYERLDAEFELELSVGPMPVALRITRLLRLQMISRNYNPPAKLGAICRVCNGTGCADCNYFGMIIETTKMERIDDSSNPSLEALVTEALQYTGPIVVWCRFIQDCEDAASALFAAGRRVGTYNGTVNEKGRIATYDGYRNGALDTIVATTSSGITRGHDLARSGGDWTQAAIYYSNSYVRRDRDQSQDRTESLDRPFPTEVVDLIGIDTRDGPIVESLRAKLAVASEILGDAPR